MAVVRPSLHPVLPSQRFSRGEPSLSKSLVSVLRIPPDTETGGEVANDHFQIQVKCAPNTTLVNSQSLFLPTLLLWQTHPRAVWTGGDKPHCSPPLGLASQRGLRFVQHFRARLQKQQMGKLRHGCRAQGPSSFFGRAGSRAQIP